jgi:hypothetical protein
VRAQLALNALLGVERDRTGGGFSGASSGRSGRTGIDE